MKMNVLKKTVTLFVAVILVFSLCACVPSEGPVFETGMPFLSNTGVSIFRVVTSTGSCSPAVADAAVRVQGALSHMLGGVAVPLTDDKDSADAVDLVLPYEILIGDTARDETQQVLSQLRQDEWRICVVGHKIVVVGETERASVQAAEAFVKHFLGYEDEATPQNPKLRIQSEDVLSGFYEIDVKANQAIYGDLPVSATRTSLLYAVPVPESMSDALSLACLQGLAASRTSEHILLMDEITERCLPYITDHDGITVETTDDDGRPWCFATLLRRYRDVLNGYILCDSDMEDESVYVAISLAHQLNAVVVTMENIQYVAEAGLDCVLDARALDDAWLRQSEYFPFIRTDVAVEQSLTSSAGLVDYAVMSGCYFYYYHGEDDYLHAQTFKFLDDGAYVLGGHAEHDTHVHASIADIGLQLVCMADVCNLSTVSALSGGIVDLSAPTQEESEEQQGKHVVCFVLSGGYDFGAATHTFAADGGLWQTGMRGNVDVSWGVPTLMRDAAGPILTFLQDTASEQDSFLLSLAPTDYSYTAEWQKENLQLTAKRVQDAMQGMGLSYLLLAENDGYDEQDVETLAALPCVDGLIRTDAFEGLFGAGQIRMVNDTPVVSVLATLSADTEDGTPEAVAEVINTRHEGEDHMTYSVVLVDVSSGLDAHGAFVTGGDPLAALSVLVGMLDESVQVVSVDEWMTAVKVE